MEERRFDAWTRTLGAATSRRQVLKGVLGGVVALVAGRSIEPAVAEAAEVCDRGACEHEAFEVMVQCSTTCQHVFHKAGRYSLAKLAGCKLGCVAAYETEKHECRTNVSGCFASTACCDHHCVSLFADPNNCGACGHACPDGHDCVNGQCQCDYEQTYCGNQCVDTQTDNNNCGGCGNTCGSCETCLGGECQALSCGSGQVCCHHFCIPECQGGPPDPNTCLCDVCDGQLNGLSCGPSKACCDQHCMSDACPDGKTFDFESCDCQCTPITCPDGQTQDPVTCQCVSICLTAPAGTNCGTNMECCQQQCVSTACPPGRTFSTDTCQCECTPIECPSGETQDPFTCQCGGKCENVVCDICHTCDPDSGACVNAPDNSICGVDLVCCNGVCQADCTCTGVTCDNGDCCPNSDDWACCDDGCCPTAALPGHGTGLAYCVAPGSRIPDGETGITWGGCCQPDQLMKLSTIHDGQCDCEGTDAQGIFCAGNMPTEYYGLPACSCGPWLT